MYIWFIVVFVIFNYVLNYSWFWYLWIYMYFNIVKILKREREYVNLYNIVKFVVYDRNIN